VRLQRHHKKAISRSYGFTRSPRCDSHFVSAILRQNDLDVAHEAVGRDGICAWQFAVPSDSYPYITDRLTSRAILRVELLLEDCRRHLPQHRFENVDVSASEDGPGESNRGFSHPPASLGPNWLDHLGQESRRLLTDLSGTLGYSQ
jgi:hypothetical protein